MGLDAQLAGRAADLVGRFGRALEVDGHRRAGLGQQQRNGLADPARTARDQGPLAREQLAGLRPAARFGVGNHIFIFIRRC